MNAAVARVKGNRSLFVLQNFFPHHTPMPFWMDCYFTKAFPTNRKTLATALRLFRLTHGERGFPERLDYRMVKPHLTILNSDQQAERLESQRLQPA